MSCDWKHPNAIMVMRRISMLLVEFDFRSKWFHLGWCVISLYLVLIIRNRDKEITNQPRLESFWSEIKLTCNIYMYNRPFRLTQCCTQFRSQGVKVLCVFHLHDNVALTFKWYGNTWNKSIYSQRIWLENNIELAKSVYL